MSGEIGSRHLYQEKTKKTKKTGVDTVNTAAGVDTVNTASEVDTVNTATVSVFQNFIDQ